MDAAPDQTTHQQEEVQMWAFIFQSGPRRSGEMGERTNVEQRNAVGIAIDSGVAEVTLPASRPEARSRAISGGRPILRRSRRSLSDGVLGLRWLA
jgi:hypothetical protein